MTSARPAFEAIGAKRRFGGLGAKPQGTVEGRVRGKDRGSVSIEFIGFLPILLLIALAAAQLGIAAYATSQAGTAARAAARMESLDDPPSDADTAARAAMSGWLADNASIDPGLSEEEVTVTVTVEIPSVIPGVGSFGKTTRTSTMPKGSDTP